MTLEEFKSLGVGGFVHFGISTYFDSDGGDGGTELEVGNEDPDLFNPVDFDPHQWMPFFRKIGAKYFNITSKHVGGFALWPSQATPHNITASNWYAANGNRNVLREILDAARAWGLEPQLYLAISDRYYDDHGDLSSGAMTAYTAAILAELLGGDYGRIGAIFFDAWGSQAGGFPDYATIDLASIYNVVKALQPDCQVTINGANYPLLKADPRYYDYPTIEAELFGNMLPGKSRVAESNSTFLPSQTWFWHSDLDYSDANGVAFGTLQAIDYARLHGYNYCGNFPPDSTGIIPADFDDVAEIMQYRHATEGAGGDTFQLTGSETAGVSLASHTSDRDGIGWTKIAGDDDLIIAVNGYVRANGTGGVAYLHPLNLPDANTGVEIRFGFHSVPSGNWGVGVGIRTSDDWTQRYRVALYGSGSGAAHFEFYDAGFNTLATRDITLDFKGEYCIRFVPDQDTNRLRAKLFRDDRMLLHLVGTPITTRASGKAGFDYQSTPASNTTGLYITGFVHVKEDWTAPAAPASLEQVRGEGIVSLSWGDVSGAAEYGVYRSTDNSTYTRIATTTQANYLDRDADDDTAYYYKVRAYDTSLNESAMSTAVESGTVDQPILDGLQDIKAKTDNLPSDPADASDIAASHASLSAAIATRQSATQANMDKGEIIEAVEGAAPGPPVNVTVEGTSIAVGS